MRASRFSRPRISINISEACAAAWAGLWADNLRLRAEGKDRYGYPDTFYLTATDLERAIRRWAEAKLDASKPQADWKEWRYTSWSSVRISTGMRGGLMDAVRTWLQTQQRGGLLESHNFGRGHISGARYRPAGEPVGPAEKQTMERKEEERKRDYVKDPLPVHARWANGALCSQVPGHHSWKRNWSTKTRDLKDRKQITCKACIKLLASPLTPAERKQYEAIKAARAKNHNVPREVWPIYKRLFKRAIGEQFLKPKEAE